MRAAGSFNRAVHCGSTPRRAMNEIRAAAELRRRADMYALPDGTPGILSNTWGWRFIAEHLRDVAAKIEAEHPASGPSDTEMLDWLESKGCLQVDCIMGAIKKGDDVVDGWSIVTDDRPPYVPVATLRDAIRKAMGGGK